MSEHTIERLSVLTGIPARHIVGPLAATAAGAAVMVPRGSWIAVVLLGLVIVASAPRPGLRDLLRPSLFALSLVMFAMWAAATTMWAVAPNGALAKVALLLALVLTAQAAVNLAGRVPTETMAAIAVALVATMTVTGVLLAFESWTGQLLLRSFYDLFPALQKPGKHMMIEDGRVLALSETEFNRRICVWAILLWPTVALVRSSMTAAAARRPTALLMVMGAAIAVATGHQSTQLALSASILVLAVHTLSSMASRALVLCAWCAAVIFVVPLTSLAYDSGLSRAPWLFNSARERVALWGYTAGEVAKRPLFGAGADTTPHLNSRMDSLGRGLDVRYEAVRPGRHSHNYYLQAWAELGAVGAFLMLVAGLIALRAVGQFVGAAQTYGLTHFALVAAMVATSFGLWQFWLHAAIAASVVILWLAATASAARQQPATSPAP